MTGRHHQAIICENGHIITDSTTIEKEKADNYCQKCGAKGLRYCSYCKYIIRGRRFTPTPYGPPTVIHLHRAPRFCYNCGNQYPWTEQKIEAAKEKIDLLDISKPDKEFLTDSIDAIIIETPKTEVAAIKVNKKLTEIGKAAAMSIRELFVDIAARTAAEVLKN